MIDACLARGKATSLFTPGSHGSMFGGNPLACRGACTVLEIIDRQQLVNNAAVQGHYLLQLLQEVFEGHPKVLSIRGRGLMVGIEWGQPMAELALISAREYRLLINVTDGCTLRLLPPLTRVDDEGK